MQTEVKIKLWDNGKVRMETPYVDGKIHGTQKRYHDNGMPHVEQEFVNGKEHGTRRWWDRNGNLHDVIPYVNDQEHGISKWWSGSRGIWVLGLHRNHVCLLDFHYGTTYHTPHPTPSREQSYVQ